MTTRSMTHPRPGQRFTAILFLAGILLFNVAVAVGVGEDSRLPDNSKERQAEFFDPDIVQTIHLEITEEHLRQMKNALPERVYVPGTFRWNDIEMGSVGVRYKGDSSSWPPSPFKRSFLIKFAEYEKGRRFLGLRRVALDNGIQFGGLFSERLITDTLRDLSVPASRANYARIVLNEEFQGVYVNVERIDKSFLERQFGSSSGTLFKQHHGEAGADLRLVGTDPAIYRQTFDLDSGDPATAYAGLVEFIRRINQPLTQPITEDFDVDAFLKTTAVMLLAGAFDQYTGWGPHNYYLHREPTSGKWTYLPWDLDVGFADQAFGHVPVLNGWHAAWPAPVPDRPLMERVVSDATLLGRYRQYATNILSTYFHPDILIPKLNRLHDQIREDLARDPFPTRRASSPSDENHDDIVRSIESFIRRRYELARQQLAEPGPRPSYSAPLSDRQEGPSPGQPSADAPSQLEVVQATSGHVELRWRDNADGEGAFIVQKKMELPAAGFQNAIGLPGENLTAATDRDVRSGVTYHYRVYAVRPTPDGPAGTGVSNEVTVTIP